MSTSTTAQDKKRPTHRIFAVTRRNDATPDAKANWTEIGAAWSHGDGKGFSLKLDYLPLNGGDLSMRVIEPRTSDQGDAASEGAAA